MSRMEAYRWFKTGKVAVFLKKTFLPIDEITSEQLQRIGAPELKGYSIHVK